MHRQSSYARDVPYYHDDVTYFVQGEAGGPIKIGRSTKGGMDSRLAALQIGNPFKLVVRRLKDGNHENRMHYRHRELRMHGEWFSPGPRLADYCSGLPGEMPTDAIAIRQAYEQGFRDGWRKGAAHLIELGSQVAGLAVRETLEKMVGPGLFEAQGGFERRIEVAEP